MRNGVKSEAFCPGRSEIEKTQLGDDNVSSEEAKTAEPALLVHGLKGRKPKLSEEKREDILTEETIR